MSQTVVGSTVTKCGLTVSSDAASWAVVKVPSRRAAKEIRRWHAEHGEFQLAIPPGDLGSVSDVIVLVQKTLNFISKGHRGATKEACGILGILMHDGCLVAPITKIARGIRVDYFFPGIVLWTKSIASECGLDETSAFAVRFLSNIWMCTLEGRRARVDVGTVRNFILLHHQHERNGKWISGVSGNTLRGLKEIAAHLNVSEVTAKWSRLGGDASGFLQTPGGIWWRDWSERYINEKHISAADKIRSCFKILFLYLSESPEIVDVSRLFSRQQPRVHLADWFAKRRRYSDAYAQYVLNVWQGFFNWLMSQFEEFTVPDEVSRDIIVRHEYFNPVRPGDVHVANVKAGGRKVRPSQTVHMALPLEYFIEIERILVDDDMAWFRQRGGDSIEWTDPETGLVQEVLCPVLPYLILLLLKLPLRQIQARRLDSGEGDEYQFDLATQTWVANTGPHAGLWKNAGVANQERGALRRLRDSWVNQEMCGFYINSNKTNDRKVLFSDRSGYVISWQNLAAIEIVQRMRAWQERYNPVRAPTEYVDVRRGVFDGATDSVARRKPACFYLFRYPSGNSREWRASPPTGQQLRMFWYEVLAELERRTAARGEKLHLISSWVGPSPQSSPYTLHGLRHGGLTRLAMQGVHPWILQNILAGHADYVMTLYYIKPDPAHISQHLEEKYMEAVARKCDELKSFLSSRTIEEAHRLAVARGKDAFEDLGAMRAAGVHVEGAIAKLDHGFCPNGRMRCSEGGRVASVAASSEKEQKKRRAFGPVPTTAGGQVDCVRCRFFITGTPFVDGLVAKTNEVSMAAYNSGRRHRELLSEIDRVEEKLFDHRANGTAPSYAESYRLQVLKQEAKAEADVLCNLAESLSAHGDMFQKVRGLGSLHRDSGSSSVPALLFEEEQRIEWRTVPKFEALDALCCSAKWYPSIRSEELQRERREKLWRMLVREGSPPVLAMLSVDEADAAADAITSYLYMKLSAATVRDVIEGYQTFEEVGIVADMTEIIEQSVGQPVVFDGSPGLSSAVVEHDPSTRLPSVRNGRLS